MLRSQAVLASLVISLAAFSSGSAQAQVWNGYSGGWYGGLPYSVYSMDAVPYYALHPPVYYSHIVPRPYGYSPYAYPPYVMTPESTPNTGPQVMINPHVTTPAKSEKNDNRVAQTEPKTILNPYVTSSVADVQRAAIRHSRPAPKVIHPSALAKSAGKLAR
jgi:hypothetical protein